MEQHVASFQLGVMAAVHTLRLSVAAIICIVVQMGTSVILRKANVQEMVLPFHGKKNLLLNL